MKYTVTQSGESLSRLGYGCMRFTKRGGVIDQAKAEREMIYALTHGVNYFDTAYIYPGSEAALGKFLAKGYRKKVHIATKLPHYLMKKIEDVEACFSEELKRLQTDYVDYYLIHMLTDIGGWERMCAMGIEQWIAEKKASGKIRHIGFSFHGGTDMFCKIVDAYPWEFCQMQYNYMDEYAQAGVRGLRCAAAKGLPVVIMEPLRGGRLTNGLPAGAKALWENAAPKRSAAEWGLRWLWNQPEVSVVLSGMNSMEQVEENVRIASETEIGTISEEERELYAAVKEEINRATKVGCTGCGYCMPCPFGVDIPTCFRCYNVHYGDGWLNGMREYVMNTTFRSTPTNASLCKQCGRCETHCPQGIPIRKELKQVVRTMETPVYRVFTALARRFSEF